MFGCVLSAELPSYLCGSDGAYAHKAFSSQVLLLHDREHVWSGVKAQETTTKAGGHREPRQPRPFWPMETRALGEKKASVALLSKGALGL